MIIASERRPAVGPRFRLAPWARSYLDPDEYLVELQIVDTTAEDQAVRLLPVVVVEA